MNAYDVKKIDQHTWLINDKDLCTSYLIIGKDAALLIDTGMESSNCLMEEIRKITDKKLIVAVTHAHYDHIGHVHEFPEIYMSKDEKIDLNRIKVDLNKFLYFDKEITFDLGNLIIKAIAFPGHTKGSTIFIDETNHNLFTGDQFGSGCGVWMQVEEAVCLSKYKKSIEDFIDYLKNHYSFDLQDWQFWGGHYGQEKTSRVKAYNPLNMDLVMNMKDLCDKVLKGEVTYQHCHATKFNHETSYYVQYKTAEMVIRKSLVQ